VGNQVNSITDIDITVAIYIAGANGTWISATFEDIIY
jgi:hypothetical protein